MTLTKATLKANDPGIPTIEFMFNPSELVFEGVMETSESAGARSQQSGKPKVSFSHVKAYTITINNIVFDTYEVGRDVVKDHIEKFKRALEFVGKEGGGSDNQRPPLYTFFWGQRVYLRSCFIEKLNYKLTLFLPDGTPVRAVIDSLTLKEAEAPKPDNSMKAVMRDRRNDSFDKRNNK
ncbi:hypothetical protein [Oscillatoria sp. FACHB-1406]|uniref:CIS tube protein n=1 Tax=Oscillatoria sp. FACHB-1406 TaxID=2692846 RepID=UPI00168366DD|nr:hypothetical protein [Oscillatoria sp. FACHB-1406]MBD2576493.1 hypothetical protein [Oscillatoria sp. FACHB-1406]